VFCFESYLAVRTSAFHYVIHMSCFSLKFHFTVAGNMAIFIDVHMPLIRDTPGVIECPNDTSGLLEFINVLRLAFTVLP